MTVIKKTKDQLIKLLFGKSVVPAGLVELHHYFRLYGPINFKSENKDGLIVAVSTNFRYGSIVTSGGDQKELDKNIKDAILTSFEVPSSYAHEAHIAQVGRKQGEYAIL